MAQTKVKYWVCKKLPYPIGHVEKILDKTLKKYGKKLGGYNTKLFFEPKTEEIGKRVSQILSERSVIPIKKDVDYENTVPMAYYRSVPEVDMGGRRHYKEMYRSFLPYRESSTIEHIGIKHKDYDMEMVVTFAGRNEAVSCRKYMTGYISERPYSKPKKRLTNQDKLRVKTRKFFVNAFNNYYKTNLDYRDLEEEFDMDHFLELEKGEINGFSDIAINFASPLLNDLIHAKEKLPRDPTRGFRTEVFIDMLVGYVENKF